MNEGEAGRVMMRNDGWVGTIEVVCVIASRFVLRSELGIRVWSGCMGTEGFWAIQTVYLEAALERSSTK